MSKKTVLIISFGTIDVDVIKKVLESTENDFREAFPEYAVHRAFASQAIIEKLAGQSGIQVDGIDAALKKLAAEGCSEVHIQPLSIVADKTYTHIKEYITGLIRSKEGTFEKMTIGRPLLLSLGLKGHPDDYAIAIEAIKAQLPELDGERAAVFMCNGSNQMEYAVLQLKLADTGLKNAYVYTAEGYPSFEGVLRQLKENRIKELILVPFVLAASEHLMQYLAGDGPDSAKSRLEAAGCKVNVWPAGLGENPAVRAIFVQHLKDALRALQVRHGQRPLPAHGEPHNVHSI